MELQADRHAFDGLTLGERAAVVQHFGLDGKTPVPSERLADTLGCSHAQARELLGSGIDKFRTDSAALPDRPSPGDALGGTVRVMHRYDELAGGARRLPSTPTSASL